jgi:hypothetical protein
VSNSNTASTRRPKSSPGVRQRETMVEVCGMGGADLSPGIGTDIPCATNPRLLSPHPRPRHHWIPGGGGGSGGGGDEGLALHGRWLRRLKPRLGAFEVHLVYWDTSPSPPSTATDTAASSTSLAHPSHHVSNRSRRRRRSLLLHSKLTHKRSAHWVDADQVLVLLYDMLFSASHA